MSGDIPMIHGYEEQHGDVPVTHETGDVRQVIERIAEEQAREVARELNDIGIGTYGVSPNPESASVAEALYVDTKHRLVTALMAAFGSQPAPSGWQQRIAAMSPWRYGSTVDRCFFCGIGYDYNDTPKHRPDCLWQNAVDALPPAQSWQQRVQEWMLACFGETIATDRLERCDRFGEEAIELLQSLGYDRNRLDALVDYVYGREMGEPYQEVGGVMVTLAALCSAHGIDVDAARETELARVWTKVEQIREKQKAKPTGSALPVALPPAPEVKDAPEERGACYGCDYGDVGIVRVVNLPPRCGKCNSLHVVTDRGYDYRKAEPDAKDAIPPGPEPAETPGAIRAVPLPEGIFDKSAGAEMAQPPTFPTLKATREEEGR
jgi:hypothetical protein